ncbi:DUF3472 domain-containing protein [Mycobacteroides abscessus]|uniref:DUF3472 domain-containing protein n=1 Tax=Mycobacteroides abscessus TaxID=36809 RepID=UPI0012FFFB1A|nr:hypothetical protein [Mycobacteroides abscessus]
MKLFHRLGIPIMVTAVAVGEYLLTVAAGSAPAKADNPASIEASNPQHFFDFPYKIPELVDDFKYTITIQTAPQTDNIFYAQQMFAQKPSQAIFYVGMQPHPNGENHAHFSVFDKDAVPLSPHCHPGADNTDGVHCSLNVPYQVGRAYTVEVKRSIDNQGIVYTATITDEITHERNEIGAWRLPATFSGFGGAAAGFTEKYKGVRTCADIPSTQAVYTDVTANGQPVRPRELSRTASNKPGAGKGVGTTNNMDVCKNVSDASITYQLSDGFTATTVGPAG